MSNSRALALTALLAGLVATLASSRIAAQGTGVGAAAELPAPVVFVSRQILPAGTIYWDEPYDMPGVGPHSRFRVAAPGKLMTLSPNGQLRTLVDGSNPQAASLRLIDVNAPDVSYDGTKIVFSGFAADGLNSPVATAPTQTPDGWRLYVIDVDGAGLRQLTFDAPQLDDSQFGDAAEVLRGADDTDPAWLPDGRIIFSSTRWPSIAHYSGVRTSNLFVMNADGTGLHRITAERNGAERPLVDPQTGQIVYARWWRNYRFALDDMSTVADPSGGYIQKDGLTADRANHVGGLDFLFRNQWHAAVINPDGTGLSMWTGIHHALDSSHYFGGSFRTDGDLVANYFPMANMAEAGGFGGLRLFPRDSASYEPIVGVTDTLGGNEVNRNPISFGVFPAPYVSDPSVLADNRIVASRTLDIYQDYGLYLFNANGGAPRLIYDNPGTSEVRARLVQSRPVPPILADTVPQTASPLPPAAEGPYDTDGTFVFDALNVYFNGAVDTIVPNAPPVGSADKIRFFIDMQRTNRGSFANLDWPILLSENKINADGSVRESAAPANVPLFEQLRTKEGTVPLTPGPQASAGHVAGMNFGRPGQVARCVGCHSGHTAIPVPENDEDAKWTNLAPGAEVRVSSTRSDVVTRGLVDRMVRLGSPSLYWSTNFGKTQDQWVELVFPEPINLRTVRLYSPPPGGQASSSVQVAQATVSLFRTATSTIPFAAQTVSNVSDEGTDAAFPDVAAQVVRIDLDSVSGRMFGELVASLAEVEVIGSGRETIGAPSRSRSSQK